MVSRERQVVRDEPDIAVRIRLADAIACADRGHARHQQPVGRDTMPCARGGPGGRPPCFGRGGGAR